MKCEICKEKSKCTLEKVKGRFKQICEDCSCDYSDYLDGKYEEQKARENE